jgi:rhodanese-related sulfurtransferase
MRNLKSKEEYKPTIIQPFITAEQLKSRLVSNEPLMVLDIGNIERYEKQHIPGSACTVYNEESKRKIMPRLPKGIAIVLVSDNEETPMQIAGMIRSMGLNARYLKGGVKAWKWEFKESADKNISPKELKSSLDVEEVLLYKSFIPSCLIYLLSIYIPIATNLLYNDAFMINSLVML